MATKTTKEDTPESPWENTRYCTSNFMSIEEGTISLNHIIDRE